MTARIGAVVVIAREDAQKCELCQCIAETRPYGKDGARICFDCAMEDEKTAVREMRKRLFGDQ